MIEQKQILTVGQLSDILADCFENPSFKNLWLEGEVSNIVTRGGHIYIDLADPEDTSLRRAIIKGIVWASVASRTPHFEIGDNIRVRGELNYYKGNSSISFIISYLQVDNSLGKALLKKRKLLEKLDKLGYLNRPKKMIPRVVNRLAIISSSEAAGYKDILNTLARRYPVKEVKLFGAIVQGPSAPDSISDALVCAYDWKPDVIIIGRGGGSKADLSCFDSEEVALTLVKSPCPVITAIGHEIDQSVADLLADSVAITPTDAANKINPSIVDLKESLKTETMELLGLLNGIFNDRMMALDQYRQGLNNNMPTVKISNMAGNLSLAREKINSFLRNCLAPAKTRLDQYKVDLVSSLKNLMDVKRREWSHSRDLLMTLSIDQTLNRGFAIIKKDEKVVGSVNQIAIGDKVDLYLKDGSLISKVEEKRSVKHGNENS